MSKRKEGEVLVTPILWSYSSNKDGLHPVKLRITHQGKRKYYQIYLHDKEKLFLIERDYSSMISIDLKNLRGERRKIREIIDDSRKLAKDVVETVTKDGKVPFSFSSFEKEYLGEDSDRGFLRFFEKYLNKLTQRGQAGTNRTYSSAYSAFRLFLKNNEIDPAEITPAKLEQFDSWLREMHIVMEGGRKRTIKAKNDTSISIYMRCLRSIYNEMAASDSYLESVYPFSRSDHDKKYKLPTSSGSKGAALTKTELQQFIFGKVAGQNDPGNPMYYAKQLFIFSFFAQGMNFKDMALLTYSNVKTNVIEYFGVPDPGISLSTSPAPWAVRI